jgi:hypothetical protein
VTGHDTNTAANGTWTTANATTNTFELQGSTGNGVGGATGTVSLTKETTTVYKVEPIRLPMVATSGTVVDQPQESGTSGAFNVLSGGWNRTDMSTQTGETWLDGVNGFPTAFNVSSISYWTMSKINYTRCFNGFQSTSPSSQSFRLLDMKCSNNENGFNLSIMAAQVDPTEILYDNLIAVCNNTAGLTFTPRKQRLGKIKLLSNAYGLNIPGGGSLTVDDLCVCGNWQYGIYLNPTHNFVAKKARIARNRATGSYVSGSGNVILGGSSAVNGSAFTVYGDNLRLRDFFINDTTKQGNSVTSAGHQFWSERERAIDGNDFLYGDSMLWARQTAVRHTASGYAYRVDVTSTTRNEVYPACLALARVAVGANAQVTVKAWMRRSNTGLTMRLVCKGGQIAGVTNDVIASMTAAADTWEELTITFTPTVAGVVQIVAEAYGGSTYSGYVDDMTISQA